MGGDGSSFSCANRFDARFPVSARLADWGGFGGLARGSLVVSQSPLVFVRQSVAVGLWSSVNRRGSLVVSRLRHWHKP